MRCFQEKWILLFTLPVVTTFRMKEGITQTLLTEARRGPWVQGLWLEKREISALARLWVERLWDQNENGLPHYRGWHRFCKGVTKKCSITIYLRRAVTETRSLHFQKVYSKTPYSSTCEAFSYYVSFTFILLPYSHRTLHSWHIWSPNVWRFSPTTSNSLWHQLCVTQFNSYLTLSTQR